MKKIYTGVGSRETPGAIQVLMYDIARQMAVDGWTLRSGHADGADIAFENGCDWEHGSKDIFLPWKGFNGSASVLWSTKVEAFQLAEQVHPAWGKCNYQARMLHGRNVHQVLGVDLDEPSALLVCWTKNGKKVGGTATALRIAEMYGVRIVNLGAPEWQGTSTDIMAAIWLPYLKAA